MGLIAEHRLVDVVGQTVQCELIDRLTATHRELIAFSLDLPRKSSARQIAAAFKQEDRLQEVLGELSDRARELLVRATFNASGVALSLGPFDLNPVYRHQREPMLAARELERRGLVFAFRTEREVFYHVPQDLQLRVRCVLVARFARTVRSATAQRWLAAPRQDLHDIAALWLEIARVPVPLILDGKIRTNSKPRLLAALPVLDLPDPDGALTQYRLELALAQLRDSGYIRLHEIDRGGYATKAKLVATGHISDALRDDVAFERFSEQEYHRDRSMTLCALALGEALVGRNVGIASFATAFEALLRDSGNSTYNRSTPTALALSGLLLFWLRGEIQFGLTHRKPVAIGFKCCPETDRSLARNRLAGLYDQFRPPDSNGPEGIDDSAHEESDAFAQSLEYPSRARIWWEPREPLPLMGDDLKMTLERDNSRITQISTLDAPLGEGLFFTP
jgi:hypothetical protein